jgi:hypothetical protein
VTASTAVTQLLETAWQHSLFSNQAMWQWLQVPLSSSFSYARQPLSWLPSHIITPCSDSCLQPLSSMLLPWHPCFGQLLMSGLLLLLLLLL